MSDDSAHRARAVLAALRASREAPLREQAGGGLPAAPSAPSAREGAAALIARLRKGGETPVSRAGQRATPSSTRPAPTTAQPMNVPATAWRPPPQPARHPPQAVAAAQTVAARAAAAMQQQNTILEKVKRLRESAMPEPTASRMCMPCPAAAATAAPARQFVPWREHVTRTTGVDPGAGTGQQVLLLCDPVQPPRGWVPRVHGLAGEPRELQKRALRGRRSFHSFAIESKSPATRSR